MLAPVQTAAPVETPLSLTEVKMHLRVEVDEDDTLISALIQAATDHVDGMSGVTGRALVTQTWTQSFCGFPPGGVLRLPLSPVSGVSSISYFDVDDASQALDSSAYRLHADASGSYLERPADVSWPATATRGDAVTVTFVAGYGLAVAVPQPLKQAMLLMIGHWYEHREAVITGTIATSLPMAVDALLAPYRRVAV